MENVIWRHNREREWLLSSLSWTCTLGSRQVAKIATSFRPVTKMVNYGNTIRHRGQMKQRQNLPHMRPATKETNEKQE